jgi:deazaflavin-dependent oxidoreductase (nitroreductase family)
MALLKTDIVARGLAAPWVVKLLGWIVPPLDKFLLRISRGWLSTAMQTIVLMQTTGAKSGAKRETVTLCMPDGEEIVLVGSNWGRDRHPAWIFNLRKEPLTYIHFRGYVGPAKARELEGDERSVMWERLVTYNPQYARYASSTERVLPVVSLERFSESP